jgi:hypothetical protein
MGRCWRYIPDVHFILDISLKLSNRDSFKDMVRNLVQLNLVKHNFLSATLYLLFILCSLGIRQLLNTCSVLDIDTDFLHRDLYEEIYMEVPKGFAIKENKRLMLQKTICGLVQSARKFYEKLVDILMVIGFHDFLILSSSFC